MVLLQDTEAIQGGLLWRPSNAHRASGVVQGLAGYSTTFLSVARLLTEGVCGLGRAGASTTERPADAPANA